MQELSAINNIDVFASSFSFHPYILFHQRKTTPFTYISIKSVRMPLYAGSTSEILALVRITVRIVGCCFSQSNEIGWSENRMSSKPYSTLIKVNCRGFNLGASWIAENKQNVNKLVRLDGTEDLVKNLLELFAPCCEVGEIRVYRLHTFMKNIRAILF
jgi:hypothetical protein